MPRDIIILYYLWKFQDNISSYLLEILWTKKGENKKHYNQYKVFCLEMIRINYKV